MWKPRTSKSKIYEKLKELTLVPILVYKERAIFDKKKFDEENNID